MKLDTLPEPERAPADDETEGGGAGWVALLAVVLLGVVIFLVFAGMAAG